MSDTFAQLILSRKQGTTRIAVNLTGPVLVDGVYPLHFEIEYSLHPDFSSATSFHSLDSQDNWLYFNGVFNPFPSTGLGLSDQSRDNSLVTHYFDTAVSRTRYYIRYRAVAVQSPGVYTYGAWFPHRERT